MNTAPRVSIGFPVYNGESFIRRSLDSLLAQTFVDFELIISDNASTDSTPEICKEYMKKDNRIRYFRQEKNMGPLWNFHFVLKQAKYDYFFWAAVDDCWHKEFLEKNLQVLESNKNIIASFNKVGRFGPGYEDSFKPDPHDGLIKKCIKKMRLHFRKVEVYSMSGPYEKKIRSCLRQRVYGICIYAVFRTEVLRKIAYTDSNPWDWAVILKSLRYGDINIIDEVLYYRYIKKPKSISTLYKEGQLSFGSLFFPRIPFTLWCYRNLERKIFFRNLDYFINLNLIIFIMLFISAIRKFRKIMF